VREVLSPGTFNDEWIEDKGKNPIAISAQLRQHRFSHAILLKNSFASALAVFLARIPARIGYAREKRGLLLTDSLHPPRLSNGKFEPRAMIDYYLAIARRLGADTSDRSLELPLESKVDKNLLSKLPELAASEGPIVVIVPGGAFGPSKCWPETRYAETADWLITRHGATVVVSVAPTQAERQIARKICDSSKHELTNLADRPLSFNELKALFSMADLVITNDTGPRHIAVAFGRKVVTLFGPNDPAWTDTECESEIQIVGNVPCAPCGSPDCRESQHLCMQSITVEMVCEAATELLDGNRKHATIMTQQGFIEASDSLFLDPDYESSLAKLGLTSIDGIFTFESAMHLRKDNLARFRSRAQFEIDTPGSSQPTTVFLKRYDKPPIGIQLKNWLCAHTKTSCGLLEFTTASRLRAFGIKTPKTICYGEQWAGLLEKRSFIITEKIRDAESLERRLPDHFAEEATSKNLQLRRAFIAQLADFVKKFHETGYRHRDLYFAHIFHADDGTFYLIDLARAFKPLVLGRRFQIKDIAQLHYSAPGRYFSNTDRMRFYLRYSGREMLSREDKLFIRKVVRKAKRMARHDIKHGREVPFEN
jgi:heptosyltransferase-2